MKTLSPNAKKAGATPRGKTTVVKTVLSRAGTKAKPGQNSKLVKAPVKAVYGGAKPKPVSKMSAPMAARKSR